MIPEALEDKDESTLYAINQVLKNSSDKPEVHDLILRILKSTANLINIMDVDLPRIKGIQASEGAELIALLTQEALKKSPLISKQSILKLRGKSAFNKQLLEAGGTYTTEETAQLLSTTTEAIHKRVKRKTLLALSHGGKFRLPVWQFSGSGIVKGFSVVLSSLKNISDVSAIQFFLRFDEDLDMNPIEALKQGDDEKVNRVKLLAKQWEQHTAR